MNGSAPQSGHERASRPGDKRYWLDEKKNVDKIWYGLIAVCALLFAVDFLVEKHPYFGIEEIPNFYGFYGFVACFFLVIAAAQLRKVLMRPENYYEKRDARREQESLGDTSGEADIEDTPITGHAHYEAAKEGRR